MATDLITKLEEAGEGSRELDGAVWYAIHEPDVEHGCLHVEQTEQGPLEVLTCELGSKYADCVGHYTTSLGAALALASRVLPGDSPGVSRNVFHGYWSAWLHRNVDGACHLVGDACTASTPALALCAAILRASEQERGG